MHTHYARLVPLGAVVKWIVLALLIAVLAGSASAFFLYALEWVGLVRDRNLWLIALLPLAGLVVGWVYHRIGGTVEAGNNLLLEEIHDPKAVVPLRMAPLVLAGTLISHLFGASVGREGTAVQMGASLSDQLTHVFRLRAEDRRILLMAGMSAGFASVFGTPLAGAVFGLEVLSIGRLRYDAILPCFVAAIVADQVVLWWGLHHTVYAISMIPPLSAWGFCAAIAAGAVFGLAGRLFAAGTRGVSDLMKKYVAWAPARPFIGGSVVAAAFYAGSAHRYIGLGIPVIQESFRQPLPLWDSLGKAAFTIVSLGSGFKGGEVTPLFYIGATLGNALAPLLRLPFSLLAGMGFVAVFAGAANVPLASTLMAIELFGPGVASYAGIACVISYLFSGHQGIYRSQRLGQSKQLTVTAAAPDVLP